VKGAVQSWYSQADLLVGRDRVHALQTLPEAESLQFFQHIQMQMAQRLLKSKLRNWM